MQFRLLTLITQLRKIISERWRPSCRTHVRSLSSKFCITFTNISCGTVAISSTNGNFQIVDCTRFSNVDFLFEVTPKKEIVGRYPTTTHFKNMRSFCAKMDVIIVNNELQRIWKSAVYQVAQVLKARNSSTAIVGFRIEI